MSMANVFVEVPRRSRRKRTASKENSGESSSHLSQDTVTTGKPTTENLLKSCVV